MNAGGRFVPRDPGPALTGLSARAVAVGDVNADGRPDIVISDGTVVRVAIQTADGSFTFTWQRRVTKVNGLATGDADGDGDADIFIVSGGATDRPDQLLVSAGDGRSFATIAVPGVARGTGDTALMVDVDEDGRDEILVLNGEGKAGPIQLLDAEPATPGAG